MRLAPGSRIVSGLAVPWLLTLTAVPAACSLFAGLAGFDRCEHAVTQSPVCLLPHPSPPLPP